MKISLRVGDHSVEDGSGKAPKVPESDIQASKRGDWEAKNRIAVAFMPLMISLAKKRMAANKKSLTLNDYVEEGKKGLTQAAKHYTPDIGAEKFQIFALDFIEKAMDRLEGKGGWLSRLFGR